jgi:two-component system NarL family response regulator
MIVDDHAVVREGLEAVLARHPDLAVVGSVASGEECLARVAGTDPSGTPDVVLLDLRMPGLGGLEVLKALRAQAPTVRVLILTSHEGDEAIHRALQAGAAGYVLKRMAAREIAEEIRKVAATRHAPLAAPVAGILTQRRFQASLTAREVDVLRRIAAGETNKEIGEALQISASTVKNHINNLLAKLDARDRTEAAMLAVQRGIIDLD